MEKKLSKTIKLDSSESVRVKSGKVEVFTTDVSAGDTITNGVITITVSKVHDNHYESDYCYLNHSRELKIGTSIYLRDQKWWFVKDLDVIKVLLDRYCYLLISNGRLVSTLSGEYNLYQYKGGDNDFGIPNDTVVLAVMRMGSYRVPIIKNSRTGVITNLSTNKVINTPRIDIAYWVPLL